MLWLKIGLTPRPAGVDPLHLTSASGLTEGNQAPS